MGKQGTAPTQPVVNVVNSTDAAGMVSRAEHEALITEHGALRADFTAFAARTADWLGQLAARATNLELYCHIRQDVRQDRDAVAFLVNFSPHGWEAVPTGVREALLAPVR